MREESTESTVIQKFAEYRLLEELGEGALFRVFRARHERLKRDVVIKLLRDAKSDNRDAFLRFRREMATLGGLEHENIVWATDAGEHEGTPYIVMEYLAGRTLQQIIACQAPLRIADICELARQTAIGLGWIHDRKMVHRDVKPSNLLLTESGLIKLLDFGLVRFTDDTGTGEGLTATATALGTPDYIAPEQATDSRSVDSRADIYSLGCTLFELLTGDPPFTGAEFDTAIKKVLAHTRQPAPAIRNLRKDVPPELAQLVDGMLAKSPNDRPPSAAAVVEVLKPLAVGHDLPLLFEATRPIALTGIGGTLSGKVGAVHEIISDGNRPSERKWKLTGWPAVSVAMIVIAAAIFFCNAGAPWKHLNSEGAPEGKSVADRKTGDTSGQLEKKLAGPETVPRQLQTEFDELRNEVAAARGATAAESLRIRERLIAFCSRPTDDLDYRGAAELMSSLKWPADARQRTDVPTEELKYAGKNPAEGAPREIVAVYGSGRMRHWLGVRAVGFSPDGKILATPGLDGVVGIWDAASGEPIARLQSYPTIYEAVGFTADGKSLVAAAGGGWFHIWDVADWRFRRAVEPKGVKVAPRWDSAWTALHPRADLLLAAGQDNAVLLCDPQTGQLRYELKGHAARVKCVNFSGDGWTAASGDDAGIVLLWDVATGTLRKSFESGHGPIWSVALTHDGRHIAVGHADGTVALTQPESQDPLRIIKVAGVAGSLAFSPGGERLLIGGGATGYGLREIDVDSGLLRRTLDSVSPWCQYPRYSPDGSTIACGYWDGKVGLWDAETGFRRYEPTGLESEIRSVAASPDGSVLAAVGAQNFALIWNVATGITDTKVQLAFRPKTVSFVGNSEHLFAAQDWGKNGVRTVGIWNVSSGRSEQSGHLPADENESPATIPGPDASFIANHDGNNMISIRDLTGNQRLQLRNPAQVQVLAISPNGRLVAAAGRDQRVRVWDALSGDNRWTLMTPGVHGTALAFSPNGQLLACGTSDTKIYCWELTSGNEVAVMAGHQRNRFGIPSLSFNPSGAFLASCSGDGTVIIWDVDKMKMQRSIAVGPVGGLINAVTFLSDGRHLVTANTNGTAYLLRLENR